MNVEEIKSKIELEDIALKNEILNKMFLNLSQDSLLDILEILNGYAERVHKSKKDTLLARCMFAYGYHNQKEFMKLLNVTKDSAIASALSNDACNIRTLNKLRHAFNIDDNTFVRIIKEIDDLGENEALKEMNNND